MAKKKEYSRWMNDVMTIGQLVKVLKKNFNPEDNVLTLTMAIVKPETTFDPETNNCCFSLHIIAHSLKDIAEDREERKSSINIIK